MWIFGYGMLMYKADFNFEQKILGRIKEYRRRLYQQSLIDRGTQKVPGLVLTLVPDKSGEVWGVAYKIKPEDEKSILKRLEGPEGDGFLQMQVKFYPKDKDAAQQDASLGAGKKHKRVSTEPDKAEKETKDLPARTKVALDKGGFNPLNVKKSQEITADKPTKGAPLTQKPSGDFITAITYMAPSDNFLYSYQEDLDNIVNQIIKARGRRGSNIDYVFCVAQGFRDLYPKRDDEHLFGVESKIKKVNPKGMDEKKPASYSSKFESIER